MCLFAFNLNFHALEINIFSAFLLMVDFQTSQT